MKTLYPIIPKRLIYTLTKTTVASCVKRKHQNKIDSKSKYRKFYKIYLLLISLFLFYSNIISQNFSINNSNSVSCIIIDEDSFSGNYKVYSVDQFGLRNIFPDEIFENNRYYGTWKVYRVNDLGLADIFPKAIRQENKFDGSINIYNVDNLGLKDVTPSAIIVKNISGGVIKIYGVDEFGIKNIFPFEEIKIEISSYTVYSINSQGIDGLIPQKVIGKNNDNVFGILLLPSIKRISFNPNHKKIENIKYINNLSEEAREKEGWIKSKLIHTHK